MIDEPHPTRPVPVEPHHLGVHAGFIDEYQPGRIKQALLANPFAAGCLSLVLRTPWLAVVAWSGQVQPQKSHKPHSVKSSAYPRRAAPAISSPPLAKPVMPGSMCSLLALAGRGSARGALVLTPVKTVRRRGHVVSRFPAHSASACCFSRNPAVTFGSGRSSAALNCAGPASGVRHANKIADYSAGNRLVFCRPCVISRALR
jgi:hypothetical protein